MVATLLKVAALALVLVLAVGCTGAPTPTPKPSTSADSASTSAGPSSPTATGSSPHDCTTNAAQGRCGPYDDYPHITGTTSSTYIGSNVWNTVPGWRQTLHATDPGNWQVTANMRAGNTGVVSYPSVGVNYGQITFLPTPFTSYSSIYSSFSEIMNATAMTSAWAAYDIWLGPNKCSPADSDCASYEVMIQHDFANNGDCTTEATASFGGSGGVPVQNWHLCKYGSELIWKLGADEQHKVSQPSGSVDILSMLVWLVNQKYLPADTGLWQIGYGWEICSTGGANENFQINRFSITPTPSSTASPSPSPS